MLGVNRKLTTHDNGTRTLEMSQPDYIESMYHRWREYLPRRQPTCPFPAKEFLSLAAPDGEPANTPDAEVEEVIALGYQQVVGELLWAMRQSAGVWAAKVQATRRWLVMPYGSCAWRGSACLGALDTGRQRGSRRRSGRARALKLLRV